jgi:anti-sigma-K factor RskA
VNGTDHLHADSGGDGPDEARSLLGAWALDAVDEAERATVERLLRDSPDACAEADRLARVADLLADAATGTERAPAGLLDSIMGQVADRSPHAVSALDVARASRRRRRATWLLSAAAVAVLVVVGVVALSRSSSDRPPTLEQMAIQAASRPGARTGQLIAADGTVAADIVVDDEGHLFVTPAALPVPGAGRTYQLWAVDGDTPVSLGLLSPDHVAVVGIDDDIRELAVTVECAGGSPQPTTTPVASGALSA